MTNILNNLSLSANSANFMINFIDKVNILYDNSGAGKSFLLNVLNKYISLSNSSVFYRNYNNLTGEIDYSADVVILDNADLYLTDEIISCLKTSRCVSVISLHRLFDYKLMDKCIGKYMLTRDKEGIIHTKRGI